VDGFAAFVLVTTLPVAVYVATHLAVLAQWVHLWSVLLLASGPLVFVTSLKSEAEACAQGRRRVRYASRADTTWPAAQFGDSLAGDASVSLLTVAGVVCAAGGLWFLGEGRAVNALRRLLLLGSLAVFLAALEERVIFHSFNQYIRLTAPWNYVAVTGRWLVPCWLCWLWGV
jgi:hypothetical protein